MGKGKRMRKIETRSAYDRVYIKGKAEGVRCCLTWLSLVLGFVGTTVAILSYLK